ncbi:hypothetical protein TBLA_0F00990 [Henningerozyma blattae CBS 6284]|uniref:Uncharacterized protein n=1 Tax=Henningerozyma blattae (strain ATCC 34711 / CBS 6284 / DSM 70876 / NBRC 10599 / NRRL Y-10934 / UCD 77-7) TaxID=1071380 RepID=I2H5J0_HENB6|nr:hypothetical protein TBLA_0F00990 [Tetrapisispora blattae CBS 6284]CCH61642.1 hypothetical protein TBLA_0F00990 [Tetrapisispora blattae CBS 6284]
MIGQFGLVQLFQEINNGYIENISINLQDKGYNIAALQNELQRNGNPMQNDEIEELVEKQIGGVFMNPRRWTRFNIMIVSYLQYCRDVNPWSLYESSDLIFKVYADLGNCLNDDSYPLEPLVFLFKDMTEYIVPIARRLDEHHILLDTRRFQYLSHTSSILSKLFNSIKPTRNVSEYNNNNNNNNNNHFLPNKITHINQLPKKQQFLLNLINKLNNIYFRIETPQLCSNIFKNFKPKTMIPNFQTYPIHEQIEFRYLLGRYYLLNNRITNAFHQLNEAYYLFSLINITTIQEKNNLERLLKYLIPTGMMMDKIPKFQQTLQNINPKLSFMYQQLRQYIRSGSIKGVMDWLKANEEQLRRKKLLIVMLEKLPMITYRYLIRMLIKDYCIPVGSNKLHFDLIEVALRKSIEDASNDISDSNISIYNGIHRSKNVENILVTLINLGFLKGNCYPNLNVCVFRKATDVDSIMPSIYERHIQIFELNPDDSWLDRV